MGKTKVREFNQSGYSLRAKTRIFTGLALLSLGGLLYAYYLIKEFLI